MDFSVSLEQYVNDRFLEELDSIGINDAREQIIFLLMEGYRLYAIRDDDGAAGREAMAQQVYDFYNKQHEPEFRVDLPPMRELRYFAFGQFFYSGAYPPYILDGLMRRIEVEKPELFEELQQTDAEFRQRAEELQEQP